MQFPKRDFLEVVLYILIGYSVLAILWLISHFLFPSVADTETAVIIRIMLSMCFADIISAKWLQTALKVEHKIEFSYNNYLSEKIHNHLSVRVIFIYVIGILFSVISSGIFWSGDNCYYNPITEFPLWIAAVYGLLIAPFIETFLCQFVIIEGIVKITLFSAKRSYTIFAGIISAILFSLGHDYSVPYMLVMLFSGLYLSFVYIFSTRKYGSKWKGFLSTVLMHALMNVLPFVDMLLERI